MVWDDTRRLSELHREWAGCTKCRLGNQRISRGTKMVFGAGGGNSVMFVGEAPSEDDEKVGLPFSGTVTSYLEQIMDGRPDEFFFTNIVACRSCEPMITDAGLPMLQRRTNIPMYRDLLPGSGDVVACRERLLAEIYIVDPILIVTFGQLASEALMGHKVTMSTDAGEVLTARLPGIAKRPSITEIKHVWVRSRRPDGRPDNMPVVPNEVLYPVVPIPFTLPFIIRKVHDDVLKDRVNNCLRKAFTYLDRYLLEARGITMQTLEEPTQ